MENKNLTEKFIDEIKNRILEGKYEIGSALPPLRDLAEEFNCSRSVINVGIAKLQAQGFLLIQKRQKTIINDFINAGSIEIIKDMTLCSNSQYKNKSIKDMLYTRMFVEIESIKLASILEDAKEIKILENLIYKETKLINDGNFDIDKITQLDFDFHKQIIKMSGNMVFLLLMNSLFDCAYSMTKIYYEYNKNYFINNVENHRLICENIKNKETKKAMKTLKDILQEGELIYKKINNID